MRKIVEPELKWDFLSLKEHNINGCRDAIAHCYSDCAILQPFNFGKSRQIIM